MIVFSGLLDESAFAALTACIRESESAQVVLATGTEVTQRAMDQLRELEVPVHAESRFLTEWLRSTNGEKE